jgi:putative chitinase
MRLDLKYKTLFKIYEINTPLRVAHFMAQLSHESGGFKYLKELGNNAYFKKYEGRKDLGNIFAGDGLRFKGRGFIQITGRANYSELSKDLKIDFVNNPELLEQEPNAILSALWFWNKKKLNTFADEDNLSTITKRINGGFNGIEDRKRLLANYKALLLV